MRLGTTVSSSFRIGNTTPSRIMLGSTLAWQSAAFTPAALLASTPTDTRSVWWSANKDDMWQDVARTAPVTAPGQNVRSVRGYTATGTVFFTYSGGSNIPVYRENANSRGYIETSGGELTLSGITNFLAPVEVHWRGVSTGTGGAGVTGMGIQYSLTGRRLGILAGPGNHGVGVPIPNGGGIGRTGPNGTVNVLSLRTYGLSANFDTRQIFASLEGVLTNSIIASESLSATDNGYMTITGTYAGSFYGGMIIYRLLTTQERTNLANWLVSLGEPIVASSSSLLANNVWNDSSFWNDADIWSST